MGSVAREGRGPGRPGCVSDEVWPGSGLCGQWAAVHCDCEAHTTHTQYPAGSRGAGSLGSRESRHGPALCELECLTALTAVFVCRDVCAIVTRDAGLVTSLSRACVWRGSDAW